MNKLDTEAGAAQTLLESLAGQLTQADYSEKEYRRLVRDLERVTQRLRKREYAQTDFCGNTFNVPERTQEFFYYLDSYFRNGRTWARVLERLDVKRYRSIIDLCPGWSPKVELGLFYLGFSGEVSLVDQSPDALKQLTDTLTLFAPRYHLKPIEQNLFSPHNLRGDLVVANHVIDDLVLSHFGEQKLFDYSAIYQAEEALERAWTAVLEHSPADRGEVIEKIAAALEQFVVPDGILVLTQYRSYLEELLDLDQSVGYSRKVLSAVVRSLESRGFIPEPELIGECLQGFAGYFGPEDCVVLRRGSF